MRSTILTIPFFAAACSLVVPAIAAPSNTVVEKQFQQWLAKDMRKIAKKAGISDAAYKTAISGISLNWKLPDLAPPGSRKKAVAQKQSEFRAPGRYFNERSLNTLVKRGRARLKQWKRTLDRIEKRYGVPRRIIVAIWGRESGFGRVKMPNNAIRALATESFMGRRKALFQKEFIAALKIVASGDISPRKMGSSWAGALGQPQFLPSNFDQYAVDFDGNGRRDIWNSVPDALASIANYLAKHGWQRGRGWGYEAKIPLNVSCALGGPDSNKVISSWSAMGITRISGKPLPGKEQSKRGYLLFPAGRYGPAYVTTPNFYVLKKYNESDVYALFVGHLADRMANNRPYRTKWKKIDSMSRSAVRKMQEKLIAKGYDVGGADGFIGYKTRTAIGLWQRSKGMKETCFPNKNIVRSIR